MGTLAIVNQTLQENNKSMERVSETLANILKEDIKRRKIQERSQKDDEEVISEKKKGIQRTIAAAAKRQPKSATGNFAQGLLGDKLFGLASTALAGVFGGIGSKIALGKVAGKALRFGLATTALTNLAQTAVDNLFENIPPEKFNIEDPEQFKKDLNTGIQTGIALKFLGFGKFASLGGAVGSAFGDDLARGLESWLGTNIINAPNPLSFFGVGPESYPVDLNNAAVQSALGTSVGMIAASLLRIVGRSLVGKLAILTVGAAAALFSKLGMSNLASLLDKYKEAKLTPRLDSKGKPPPAAPKPKPPPPPPRTPLPPPKPWAKPPPVTAPPAAAPPPSAPAVLTDSTKRILQQLMGGELKIPGIEVSGSGADARFVKPGTKSFLSNAELNKLAGAAEDVISTSFVSKASSYAKTATRFVGKALLPVGISLDAYAAAVDEEMKALEVGFMERMSNTMDVGLVGLLDFAINKTAEGLNTVTPLLPTGSFFTTDFDPQLNLSGKLRQLQLDNAAAIQENGGRYGPLINLIMNNDNSTQNNNMSTSGGNRPAMISEGMSATDSRYDKKYMGMRGFGVAPGQVF